MKSSGIRTILGQICEGFTRHAPTQPWGSVSGGNHRNTRPSSPNHGEWKTSTSPPERPPPPPTGRPRRPIRGEARADGRDAVARRWRPRAALPSINSKAGPPASNGGIATQPRRPLVAEPRRSPEDGAWPGRELRRRAELAELPLRRRRRRRGPRGARQAAGAGRVGAEGGTAGGGCGGGGHRQ